MDDNVKKFQDFLGAAEGAGYDTIVGGKQKITDYSKHPGIIGLRTAEGPSTAAGKYQITKTTYDDFAPKLGITDFSPESQDRIAMAIIEAEGAGDDVRNGNWTSAVNKLGGRWASLPSSKYKQPKRDAQFVQKHLGDYADTPASKFDQNTPGAISPSYGASQKDMLIADAQRDAKYGGVVNQIKALPEAVSLGFQNENSVYNFFRDQGMQNYDPEFSWSEEMATEILTGIPRDNRDYILQAGSRAEAMTRRGRVMEALENQKQLGEMGLAGVAGTLTGSLVDLPTLVGFLPVVGGTAMVSRTSRLANALASGFAGAASNVAVDAVTMKYRPLGTPDELYFSAAAGLGFGALFGGISKPAGRLAVEVQELADVGKREYHRLSKDEIHGAGYEVTPKGAAAFKDPTPQGRADVAELDALRAERQQTPQAPRESAVDIPGTRSSSRATLKSLADEAEDPEVRRLAARLGDQMDEDVPIHPTTKESPGGGSRPFYDAKRHAVFVPEDVTEKQALHEIAHAATVSRIDYGRANPQSSHGRIVSELEEAFQGARQAAAKETFTDSATKHYLKDLQEFVAGLYSGKSEFTDFLAKVKPTGATESLLGRVFNAARKLLGLPVDDANALSKSMGLTDKLIETPAPLRAADDGLEGIHFAPMDGATVDPQVIQAAHTARLPDIFGWSFGLEHKLRKVKDLPKAFALADKLLGTTVGYKDHGVVKRNAWDQTIQLGDGWATNVKKTATVQFEDYVKRSGRKWWERGNLAKEWNTQLGDYIRGVDGEYDKTVIATGDQIRKTLGDVVDHINNPAKQTGGTKKGLTQDTYLDEQGNELLTDALPKNENYLPRANDAQKWSQMVQQFGRGFVQDFWSGAFKAANVDASDEVAKRFGKWYVERVESAKVNRDGDFLTEQLRGYDKEALKESMVRSGMSDPEAQDVLDTMFPKDHTGSKGLTANTKKRSSIDETYSVDVMVNGEAHKVSINDFINTDTMGVLDGYFRRMAGAISLANHTDIYKQSDVGKAILDATTVELGSTIKPSHLAKLREDFQFTVDRLLHRPLEQFTVFNKAMEMWRNFNVIRLMGAAVYNQIQEMSQIVGTMGWKATLGAIPELGAMVRSAKTGKLANPILDQIENMTGGAGSDLVMRADFNPSDDWVRELGDTSFNRWLDRADNAIKKGANGVLKYTGMTGLMVQQKRIHAIALVNHFVDAAVDGKKLDFSPERLAWMGLSEGDTNKVLDGLKKFYRESTGETGKQVKNVDFEGWKAEDPEGLSKFITATQRESRRVVQENDLGASIPTMGYGWAKTMFQFQNFVMQAWNKSMLFAMNHRDFQTFSTMMYGAFFAGIVYVARTQQQMLGMGDEERQKFADKRLSTKQIVANSFGRTAQASLLPGMIDQVSPVPIFSGMRTTSDTTDFLSSNPTAQGVSTLFAAFRKGVRNGLSDDYQYTQQDMRSYLRMVPFNNVIGVSGLLNSLASDMPTSEEAVPQQ